MTFPDSESARGGHAAAHAPHVVHSVRSIFPGAVIAPAGQAKTQRPQPMHFAERNKISGRWLSDSGL